MFDLLYTILAFLFAISILIAIHEFGHFWVARRMDVKVLRYSIGFGKPLWRRRFGPDKTEFVLASLPLGGYVKMLDGREGEVPVDEAHRAFDNQSVRKRFAIVFAGPAFNFIFAIIAYWLVFVIGVAGLKPVVGEVLPDSAAAYAGLKSGQEILSINEEETPSWDVALETILPAMVDRGKVNMKVRDNTGLTLDYTLNLETTDKELEPGNLFEILGFWPWRPAVLPLVGQVVADSPAEKSGLRSGDRIISIDGVEIKDWMDLVRKVSAHPNETLEFIVLREEQQTRIAIHTQSAESNGKTVGRIGIGPKEIGQFPDEMKVVHRYGMAAAVGKAFERCWNNSMLTLKMLGKIVIGELSLKNLSGPLNIAVYAGHSASAGPARFLDFLAIVSISLGILNLLPIPVLDGGHLMFYLVEAVKGRPVSEQTEIIGQQIGIAILVLLMSLALYNDLVRLLN